MANKFLTKYDYQTLIDEDNLNEITDDNDRLLFDAMDAAIEEVAGYIRHRYDDEKVFKVVIPYSDSTTFAVDDRVFWSENAYDNTATYVTGNRVSQSGNIYEANQNISTPEDFDISKWDLLAEDNTFYVCIQSGTGNLPSNAAYFTAGDNRNKKIVEVTVDITLYNIHSKISPRNIPDVRRVRFDGAGNKKEGENAISYLEKVQRATITPNLPVIEDAPQNTQRIAYGTQSNLKYSY